MTRIVVCTFCEREVNPGVETVWYGVQGWEHERDAGGTNHVALRKRTGETACHVCMDKLQRGLSPNQAAMV